MKDRIVVVEDNEAHGEGENHKDTQDLRGLGGEHSADATSVEAGASHLYLWFYIFVMMVVRI
jgi:hypothetical protein